MTTITKQEKFVQVREFAHYVIREAGKGQTIAALVEDFNTTAEVLGFSHVMIAKPGRVAKLIEAMELVIKRLEAMPEYAQPAPEITPEQRADHEQTAEALTGILKAHGIDPQDWDAVMDYLFSTQGHPLKYMVKIYVDYIHGTEQAYNEQLEALREGMSHSDSWHRITDQESRAAYTNACNFAHSKSNRLPRGNCAVRMLGLGWEFNY